LTVNLHISLNRLSNASRILREVHTVMDSNAFQKCIIVALWSSGLDDFEKISGNIEIYRIRLKTRKLPKSIIFQPIKYIELMFILFVKFSKDDIKVVNSHSVDALPIGIMFKMLKRAKLIYDAHELETETHGLHGLRKRISKTTERACVRFIDRIIVVSDSIKEWYEKEYGLRNVYTVKNFSYMKWSSNEISTILKEKFGIDTSHILFIYQGKFTGGRGIEALLNAFSRLESNKHIVFMGYGELQERIISFANHNSNIHFQLAVSPEQVNSYTKSADVGINLTDNSCLSRYYALSNKLFEYLSSGLPVIVSDFPERARIIDTFHCGWKIRVHNFVESSPIYDLIHSLTKDEIAKMKVGAAKLKNEFVWEREEDKLLDIYRSLGL